MEITAHLSNLLTKLERITMIKVGTLFSGIGAPEQAFNKLGVDYELLFAGDIDRYCKRAYFANYKID